MTGFKNFASSFFTILKQPVYDFFFIIYRLFKVTFKHAV